MDTRISAKDITFSYTGRPEKAVFRHVDFSVRAGDVFCLLGPNGTGKSTLLKCLARILQPQEGKIRLDGRDVAALGPSAMAKKTAYVPQTQVSAFPFLIRDIVVMGRAPHLSLFASPSRKDSEIAARAMETAGVLHLADRPCNSVSGGEWQLTLIARALAQDPEILLLDEPTSHLDIGNQLKILTVVKGLADQGLTIVMASHFPDHALLVATVAAILNQGRLVCRGKAEEVITERNLRQTYGVDVKVLYIGDGVDRKVCLFPALESHHLPPLSRG